MSITGANLRTKAKQLAQNGPGGPTGIQLLLTDPGDYDEAIADALRVFDADRPNLRVFDYTVATAGFRWILNGGGEILPVNSINSWSDGGSYMVDVWFPYDAAVQALEPLDRNTWRVLKNGAAQNVLELLTNRAAVGQILRLEYVVPHKLNETDANQTSILPADQRAIITLAASFILLIAGVKAVQNTGNTGLPNDIVDRRSQSDIFKSRAKDLRDMYADMVGQGSSDSLGAASGFKELDSLSSYGGGRLWHPDSLH